MTHSEADMLLVCTVQTLQVPREDVSQIALRLPPYRPDYG